MPAVRVPLVETRERLEDLAVLLCRVLPLDALDRFCPGSMLVDLGAEELLHATRER